MSTLSLESLAEAFARKDAEIARLKELITELCDTLIIESPAFDVDYSDLIKRARKATK